MGRNAEIDMSGMNRVLIIWRGSVSMDQNASLDSNDFLFYFIWLTD
jgi:hypothetical protein